MYGIQWKKIKGKSCFEFVIFTRIIRTPINGEWHMWINRALFVLFIFFITTISYIQHIHKITAGRYHIIFQIFQIILYVFFSTLNKTKRRYNGFLISDRVFWRRIKINFSWFRLVCKNGSPNKTIFV